MSKNIKRNSTFISKINNISQIKGCLSSTKKNQKIRSPFPSGEFSSSSKKIFAKMDNSILIKNIMNQNKSVKKKTNENKMNNNIINNIRKENTLKLIKKRNKKKYHLTIVLN